MAPLATVLHSPTASLKLRLAPVLQASETGHLSLKCRRNLQGFQLFPEGFSFELVHLRKPLVTLVFGHVQLSECTDNLLLFRVSTIIVYHDHYLFADFLSYYSSGLCQPHSKINPV